MALTEKEKKQKKELHGKLRGFLAQHRIKMTEAAEFFGEDPGTFIACLSYDRFSNDKVKEFLDQKEDLRKAQE